mmetsp:Transcript_110783/g.320141  ORF Transcript_110783/g.320141 Transcript_110783/m.320141 type:complete len:286 (+) Transcript_110783:503-1360(+)
MHRVLTGDVERRDGRPVPEHLCAVQSGHMEQCVGRWQRGDVHCVRDRHLSAGVGPGEPKRLHPVRAWELQPGGGRGDVRLLPARHLERWLRGDVLSALPRGHMERPPRRLAEGPVHTVRHRRGLLRLCRKVRRSRPGAPGSRICRRHRRASARIARRLGPGARFGCRCSYRHRRGPPWPLRYGGARRRRSCARVPSRRRPFDSQRPRRAALRRRVSAGGGQHHRTHRHPTPRSLRVGSSEDLRPANDHADDILHSGADYYNYGHDRVDPRVFSGYDQSHQCWEAP